MAHSEEHAQPIIQAGFQAQFTINYQGNSYEFTKSPYVQGAFVLSIPHDLIEEGQNDLQATVNSAWNYPSKSYIACVNNKKYTAVGDEPITEDGIEDGEDLPADQLPGNVSDIIDLMRNLVATSPEDFELNALANPLDMFDGIL